MKISELIEHKNALMTEKANYDKMSRETKEKIEKVDRDILIKLEDAGIEQARAGNTTVFVQHSTVPNVEDWDAYEAYVYENKAFHLYERRPAVRAWRELYEGGETVPGTEPFTKTSLGKRSG